MCHCISEAATRLLPHKKHKKRKPFVKDDELKALCKPAKKLGRNGGMQVNHYMVLCVQTRTAFRGLISSFRGLISKYDQSGDRIPPSEV